MAIIKIEINTDTPEFQDIIKSLIESEPVRKLIKEEAISSVGEFIDQATQRMLSGMVIQLSNEKHDHDNSK